MGEFRPQIGEEQARIPEVDFVGGEQMRSQAGDTACLHCARGQSQGMPRRDDRGRRAAGDRDTAERQNGLPEFLPVKIAGRVLRERAQQRAIVLGLLKERRIGKTVLSPDLRARPHRRRQKLSHAAPIAPALPRSSGHWPAALSAFGK